MPDLDFDFSKSQNPISDRRRPLKISCPVLTVAGTKTCKLENLKFQIDCHDLSYFFKFMIIREKLIPHVFTGQNHILTHQMGTPMSRFPLPLLKIHVFGPKIRKFPKVGRVWGDPKSKFRSKIPFLKRSRLDLFFTKKLKTFQKKLTKFFLL